MSTSGVPISMTNDLSCHAEGGSPLQKKNRFFLQIRYNLSSDDQIKTPDVTTLIIIKVYVYMGAVEHKVTTAASVGSANSAPQLCNAINMIKRKKEKKK